MEIKMRDELGLALFEAKLEYALCPKRGRANWAQLLLEAEQFGEEGMRLYRIYFELADD